MEEVDGPDRRVATGAGATRPVALTDVDAASAAPRPTGVAELDRVLAGGLVAGSVTLLSGPPGVGKSTLALQVAAGAGDGVRALYVAAEESVAQVGRRARRLGLAPDDALGVVDDPSIPAIEAAVDAHRPDVLVVDSIQTVHDDTLDSGPGSVTQVRACAQRLAEVARSRGIAVVLIGHVTKDGQIAGPRLLEHLVDTVVTMDADTDPALRFVRATKHRFGAVGELGVFRMEAGGLHGVVDAAGLFLTDRPEGVPGSVVTPTLDGRRVMVAEIQALVTEPGVPASIELAQGIDRTRLGLVVAVTSRVAGLGGRVFASVAGGGRVTEPGADLAVAVALASAATGVPVRADTVVCGEVGLVGEVRRVAMLVERIREAARLGFRRAVVPAGTPAEADGVDVEVVRVGDIATAIDAALGDVASSVPYRAVRHQRGSTGPQGPVRPALVT